MKSKSYFCASCGRAATNRRTHDCAVVEVVVEKGKRQRKAVLEPETDDTRPIVLPLFPTDR